MVGHCFNPECREELRYLRQGSFYAWDSGVAPEHSEFFWLCSACSRTFLVACDGHGRPLIWPRWLRIERNPTYSRVRRVFKEFEREDTSRPMVEESDSRPMVTALKLDAA
jgi:hypothetical protein